MTSLPEVLFQADGGMQNVVEGSVIQLFCSIEFTRVTFSWTKDGRSVVINVPHLRERTTSNSNTTTSMLTIDNFQSTDNGLYQCLVQSDSGGFGIGETANLRGMHNQLPYIAYCKQLHGACDMKPHGLLIFKPEDLK